MTAGVVELIGRKSRLPQSENGDRLSRDEFERCRSTSLRNLSRESTIWLHQSGLMSMQLPTAR